MLGASTAPAKWIILVAILGQGLLRPVLDPDRCNCDLPPLEVFAIAAIPKFENPPEAPTFDLLTQRPSRRDAVDALVFEVVEELLKREPYMEDADFRDSGRHLWDAAATLAHQKLLRGVLDGKHEWDEWRCAEVIWRQAFCRIYRIGPVLCEGDIPINRHKRVLCSYHGCGAILDPHWA